METTYHPVKKSWQALDTLPFASASLNTSMIHTSKHSQQSQTCHPVFAIWISQPFDGCQIYWRLNGCTWRPNVTQPQYGDMTQEPIIRILRKSVSTCPKELCPSHQTCTAPDITCLNKDLISIHNLFLTSIAEKLHHICREPDRRHFCFLLQSQHHRWQKSFTAEVRTGMLTFHAQ